MHDDIRRPDRAPDAAEPTVTVVATAEHTYEGDTKHVGDTYDVPESLVDSLRRNGFALPVDEAKAKEEQLAATDDANKAEAEKPRLRKRGE